jgi:hypothetical protein
MTPALRYTKPLFSLPGPRAYNAKRMRLAAYLFGPASIVGLPTVEPMTLTPTTRPICHARPLAAYTGDTLLDTSHNDRTTTLPVVAISAR